MKKSAVLFAFMVSFFGCVKDEAKPDVNPPEITMNGQEKDTVVLGNGWTDAGVTAKDAEDGNLTAAVVIKGSVTTSFAGTYTVSYYVEDKAGNFAEATRTVTVKNDADKIQGDWSAQSNCGGTENNISSFSKLTSSNSFNGQFTFTGLLFNNTGHDLVGFFQGNSIQISPFQGGQNNTYSGSGIVASNFNSFTLNVGFTPSSPGGNYSCVMVFTRR
jgi:hypothetical protein